MTLQEFKTWFAGFTASILNGVGLTPVQFDVLKKTLNELMDIPVDTAKDAGGPVPASQPVPDYSDIIKILEKEREDKKKKDLPPFGKWPYDDPWKRSPMYPGYPEFPDKYWLTDPRNFLVGLGELDLEDFSKLVSGAARH